MKIFKRHSAYAADRSGPDAANGYVTLGEVEAMTLDALRSGVPRDAQLSLEVTGPGHRFESGVARIGLHWSEELDVDVVAGATESPLGAPS
jgi:hypothetical protein